MWEHCVNVQGAWKNIIMTCVLNVTILKCLATSITFGRLSTVGRSSRYFYKSQIIVAVLYLCFRTWPWLMLPSHGPVENVQWIQPWIWAGVVAQQGHIRELSKRVSGRMCWGFGLENNDCKKESRKASVSRALLLQETIQAVCKMWETWSRINTAFGKQHSSLKGNYYILNDCFSKTYMLKSNVFILWAGL